MNYYSSNYILKTGFLKNKSKTMRNYLFLLFFLAFQFGTANAQILTAKDSVYLASFPEFSKNVNTIKDQVWPGMTIGPFCGCRLNGPALLMNHPNPPKNSIQLSNGIYLLKQSEFGLNGATQTEINGVLTAHNDFGNSRFASVNQFYAELFHELHHVYQRNFIKNIRFDNVVDLLTYPEDFKNNAIKQYENEILLQLFNGNPKTFDQNMNLFYSCRNKRLSIIGTKYLDYEKATESIEGPAFYCEYQYMKLFGSGKVDQEYTYKNFIYPLDKPWYSRDKVRPKCLFTGMIQCLILSKHFTNWQEDYYSSGLYLNDYFFKKFNPQIVVLPDLSTYIEDSKYFTKIASQKHKDNFNEFNKQKGIKITLIFKSIPDFKGFDPMNAEAFNDSTILHSTILKLGKMNNKLEFINYKAITSIAGQIWVVKSIVFFLPLQSSFFKDDRLIYNVNGININWHIVNVVKFVNAYSITLE